MCFVRRIATTVKVPIPEKARKDIEFVFMHIIVHKIEKYQIPHSLVLNADQTPLKYVPLGRSTLAQQNSKDVPLAGSADKRAITATFAQTLDNQFLLFNSFIRAKQQDLFQRSILQKVLVKVLTKKILAKPMNP